MCLVSNGHVPSINHTNREIPENVLQYQVLNVAMEVTESLCIMTLISGIFGFDDDLGIGTPQEETTQSFVYINDSPNEKLDWERSKVLTQTDDNDIIGASS